MGFMGALIFVVSCMPIPVPTAGTCSHPAGTGISAILIGPIMSIFVTSIALLIQALFLAHGGITTWGADIVSMGIAGSFAAYLIFKLLRKFNFSLFVCGFAAGLFADWATYMMTSFELASGLHGTKTIFSLFMAILIAFIPTQLPLGLLEGFLTGGMIVFVAKRRPDILFFLGVLKEPGKHTIKYGAKIASILLVSLILFANCRFTYAAENAKWSGIDENVVERIAQEQGRPAWKPFINTDQGDLLLFVFLLAGAAGGFLMGYNYRKLFVEKGDKNVAGSI
ncbi:MAG: energy-coupling factor ABC transporter permease [Candidatus Omnitrophota bacterium]|nr:energy-coupling factor ABC transporter permease [Candidatus Omnitrophota bacterium]